MNARRLLHVFLPLLAPAVAAAGGTDDWALRIEPEVFSNDGEYQYAEQYRPSGTVVGAMGKAYLARDLGPLHVELGAFGRSLFGDTNAFANVSPWIRLVAHDGPWSIHAGALDNRNQFGLHDALSMRRRDFAVPLEQGLRVRYDGDVVQQDVWLSWLALNTPVQMELFHAAYRGHVKAGGFNGDLSVHGVHRGGDEFQGVGRVQTNLSGCLCLSYDVALAPQRSVGLGVDLLGSMHFPVYGDPPGLGGGAEPGIAAQFDNLRARLSVYLGRALVAELGNGIYRTPEPLWHLAVEQRFEVGSSELGLYTHAYLVEGYFALELGLSWRISLTAWRFAAPAE